MYVLVYNIFFCFKDGTCAYLVKDRIADADKIDNDVMVYERQQVLGQPLPEVQQEVLDLRQKECACDDRNTIKRLWYFF